MNLISNTCTGALIYRDYLKKPYNNPFCWNFIESDDFYNLIINYENINFNNFELIKKDNWKFYIKIDNLITIYYAHYKFNKNYNTITTIKDDVYYNKIWEYIIEKYKIRTKRMLELNEPPIFIVGSTNIGQLYTKDQLQKFCTIKDKKIFLFSKEKLINIPENITYINQFEYDYSNKNAAKIIYNYIKGI